MPEAEAHGGRPTPEAGEGLYAALGLDRAAEPSAADVRRAYLRRALKLHPDRPGGDAAAFRAAQRAYAVLSDPGRRAAYDATGRAGEEALARVTADDIRAFEEQFRGSAEEAAELRALYAAHGGRMDRVFAHLVCSREDEDGPRFRRVVREGIAAGELEELAPFVRWEGTAQAKGAARKRGKRRGGGGDDAALVALIQGRGAQRQADLLASLEAKYGQKKRKKGTRKEQLSP